MSTTVNLWSIVFLWAGVAQLAVISGRWRTRIPQWAAAIAVFGGILCLAAGLAMLII